MTATGNARYRPRRGRLRLLVLWVNPTRLPRPRALPAAATIVSVAALVLWVVSLRGTWEVRDRGHRPHQWAVEGSLALAGLAVGRLRRSSTWRLAWATYTLAGGVIMAAAIWVHAEGVTFPEGASALGFLAMVGVGVAAALWGASELLQPCPRRLAVAVLAVTVAVLAGCSAATSGWTSRSLASHTTVSALPTGPTPLSPTTKAWTRPIGDSDPVTSDGTQLYVAGKPDTTVTAVDPRTGRTRWTWHRPSGEAADVGAGSGSVAVGDDTD